MLVKRHWPVLLACLVIAPGLGLAAERPTFNHTADPRPDILPNYHHLRHNEYRRVYNRPTHVGGWIASKIAPSSLEAMVWCENVRAGRYDPKHQPPVYKRYYYPKPWEALNVGSRPDFPEPRAIVGTVEDPADDELGGNVLDDALSSRRGEADLQPMEGDDEIRLPLEADVPSDTGAGNEVPSPMKEVDIKPLELE